MEDHDSPSWHATLFWLVILAIAGGAEILVRCRILSPASYAAPTEIVRRSVDLLLVESFALDLAATALRTLVSVVIGFPLGILTGLGLYALGGARRSGELILDFARSVPLTALIPVFIAVYGIGEQSKIAIGSAAALLVTAITVWIGMQELVRRLNVILRFYRPPLKKRVKLVLLPGVLPTLTSALRLSVSSAIVLVVVSEMFLGTSSGIGKVINDKAYSDDRPGQYAAVFFAGLLGYACNLIAQLLKRLVDKKIPSDNNSGGSL